MFIINITFIIIKQYDGWGHKVNETQKLALSKKRFENH
jgi:hypothetical protein